MGLCQPTRPAPTANQTWNWKDNVRGGWKLFLEKEAFARAYPGKQRKGERFKGLVRAWNQARTAQGLPAIPVELPDYTAEQLELDTLRGFNGYANNLHEYRIRMQGDQLWVTVSADGNTARAEWERIPAAERGAVGDRNYVDNVLAREDF